MLVDFNVKNFRSFNERQDFSLIKSKSDENLNNSFNINENSNFSLLKTAAIYGANASGKSNFLKALSTMKRMVTGNYQRGDKLPVVPFKLNSLQLISQQNLRLHLLLITYAISMVLVHLQPKSMMSGYLPILKIMLKNGLREFGMKKINHMIGNLVHSY